MGNYNGTVYQLLTIYPPLDGGNGLWDIIAVQVPRIHYRRPPHISVGKIVF
jgi:hypothetical protein